MTQAHRWRKNSRGFMLIQFLVMLPMLSGVIAATGAGSLLISRYRTSLGICRMGLLETLSPLEVAARQLLQTNTAAKKMVIEEIGVRARLVACQPLPITCAEPAAQLAKLEVKMHRLNQKRRGLRQSAEMHAEILRKRVAQDLRQAHHSPLKSESRVSLTFDQIPAFATTPVLFLGSRFEARNTLRQSYVFHPLKHVPGWVRGLLGQSLKWNSIPMECAVTLKNQIPPKAGLTVVKR